MEIYFTVFLFYYFYFIFIFILIFFDFFIILKAFLTYFLYFLCLYSSLILIDRYQCCCFINDAVLIRYRVFQRRDNKVHESAQHERGEHTSHRTSRPEHTHVLGSRRRRRDRHCVSRNILR